MHIPKTDPEYEYWNEQTPQEEQPMVTLTVALPLGIHRKLTTLTNRPNLPEQPIIDAARHHYPWFDHFLALVQVAAQNNAEAAIAKEFHKVLIEKLGEVGE